ncbi:heme-binding protein [Synechocystis sp. CS-94]|uniref:GlcG/HbpS family heme-binding protein n=1 Tax=Synechocystis sp. CS-94 TaxID=2847986 RepID=UPI00223BA74E|nr:heme-binding protein [Synechocystis sp. CS-94]
MTFSSGALALKTYYQLPVALAVEAAMEAVNSCQRDGYNVTATVVNQEGLVQAVVRGDGATPHTIEYSLYKAFTLITLGPITGEDSTEAIAKKMTPTPLPLGSLPLAPDPVTGLSFSTGGLAIKVGDELVAAIGVSGSPNGNLDQICGIKGIEKIKSRLVP